MHLDVSPSKHVVLCSLQTTKLATTASAAAGTSPSEHQREHRKAQTATNPAAFHASTLNTECCLQVSTTVLWPGVMRCRAPAHEAGAVRLCLTLGDARPCSKVISFGYRESPPCVQSRADTRGDRCDLQQHLAVLSIAKDMKDKACLPDLHGFCSQECNAEVGSCPRHACQYSTRQNKLMPASGQQKLQQTQHFSLPSRLASTSFLLKLCIDLPVLSHNQQL